MIQKFTISMGRAVKRAVFSGKAVLMFERGLTVVDGMGRASHGP